MPKKKLYDGKKTFKSRIHGKEPLGKGHEGKVYSRKVTINGSTRELAEKIFKLFILFRKLRGLRKITNPKEQFNTILKLVELNKKKKLGLRIAPEIFLRKRFLRKSTLLTTKLEEVKDHQFKKGEFQDFYDGSQRQVEIAEKNGFKINRIDPFLPVRNTNTGKVEAVLVDFGQVTEIK